MTIAKLASTAALSAAPLGANGVFPDDLAASAGPVSPIADTLKSLGTCFDQM